jgi:predicted flap endonuclease-1-like 5' DNA nuclease
MSWMTIDSDKAQIQAEKALYVPIGAASPLWLAYGGMAAGAIGYWWMTQWMKPLNLEALKWPGLEAASAPIPTETPAPLEVPAIAAAALEPVIEALEVAEETAADLVKPSPDDLTVLVGIGPTLAAKLGDLGVSTYADIAAWTEADVERFDKQLKLIGRITRDKWIDQARQLAEAA